MSFTSVALYFMGWVDIRGSIRRRNGGYHWERTATPKVWMMFEGITNGVETGLSDMTAFTCVLCVGSVWLSLCFLDFLLPS